MTWSVTFDPPQSSALPTSYRVTANNRCDRSDLTLNNHIESVKKIPYLGSFENLDKQDGQDKKRYASGGNPGPGSRYPCKHCGIHSTSSHVQLPYRQHNRFQHVDVKRQRRHGDRGLSQFIHRHHWLIVRGRVGLLAAFDQRVARVQA